MCPGGVRASGVTRRAPKPGIHECRECRAAQGGTGRRGAPRGTGARRRPGPGRSKPRGMATRRRLRPPLGFLLIVAILLVGWEAAKLLAGDRCRFPDSGFYWDPPLRWKPVNDLNLPPR